MATLPTDFQDDVLDVSQNTNRKYNMIENQDGSVSFEDVTRYIQEGSQYGAQNVNAQNTEINALNSRLTLNTGEDIAQFTLDKQGDEWGWNEDPARGADTFHPFKKGLQLDYIGSGNTYSGATFTINLPDADNLTSDNFFFKVIDSTKHGNHGSSSNYKFGSAVAPSYNPSTHVLTIGRSGWDIRDNYNNDFSIAVTFQVYCVH